MYQPGDVLLETYRIDAPIGSGGFAQVYRATVLANNAVVALKVFDRQRAARTPAELDKVRRRFEVEATLGRAIDHPHVIRVHEYVQDGSTPIVVMEFAPRQSLYKRLDAGTSGMGSVMLPVDEALRILAEAAAGLAALHACDAVHRDIKPSNLLFDRWDRVKVGDLGLAQLRGEVTDRTLLGDDAPDHPGTVQYMSPEQSRTRSYLTPASDIYSLGLVGFEMLTGRVYQHQRRGTRLAGMGVAAPPALEDVLASMLAEDREARPLNGAELVKALTAITGGAAQVQPATMPDQAPPVRVVVPAGQPAAAPPQVRAGPRDRAGAKRAADAGHRHHLGGCYREAVLEFSRAVELDPLEPEYWWARAKSYDMLNEHGRAIADGTRAVELAPRNDKYRGWRGNSYHWHGDYQAAIDDYTVALQLAPESGRYYYSRSLSFAAKGDALRAAQDRATASKLGYHGQ